MASFDIVNRVNTSEIDNAVNNTLKEVQSRYDFRGLRTEITLDSKNHLIHLVAADSMKMNALREMLTRHLIKRKLSPKVLEFGNPEGTSKGHLKMDIQLKEGIDRETARRILKEVKSLNLKVKAAIQEDQVRVSGKKKDDLQQVITHLRSLDLPVPLQFVNMK